MKPHYLLLLFLLNQSCDTNETSLTVAFGSCNDPEYNLSVLPHLSSALDSADYMIWLGDNVYLKNDEWKHRDSVEAKYREVFERAEFQELLAKSEHLAIWDDHDAGPNDCSSLSEGLDLTMDYFKYFWKPSLAVANDGVAHAVLLKHGRRDFTRVSPMPFPVHILAGDFNPTSSSNIRKRADRRKRWSDHQVAVIRGLGDKG